MRIPSLAFLLGVALAASACADAALPTASESPVVLAILDAGHARVRLAVGDTLSPRLRTRAGGALASMHDAPWRVSDSSVAIVDDGRILVLRPGETTVSAQLAGTSYNLSVSAWGTVTVQRLTVAPRSLTMRLGERARLAANLQYSNGVLVPLRSSVDWRTLDPAVVAVRNGQVVALAAGTGRVVTYLMGFADTATITVGPPAEGAPAVSASDIAVAVQRTSSGTGAVVVTSGIPLVPGALRPGEERSVRLYLEQSPGGPMAEQPVHVEVLRGRHKDGSARAVLVQFTRSLSGITPVAGRLTIGTARPVTSDEPRPTASRALPAAAVLPTDPSYLVRTEFAGPTQTAAATTARGGVYAQYDADFAKWADYHWDRAGAAWAENYYDRAATYYAMWIRTGRVDYWSRAAQLAVNYRRDYLEANNYATSPYWSQMEGIERHYLATGDSASLFTVGRIGEQFLHLATQLGQLGNGSIDSRNQARTLQALFLAWRLDARAHTSTDWAVQLDLALDRVLSTQQPDGSYHWPIFCDGSSNFMAGILNDQLIKHYTYYKADPRIPVAVERSVDFLWNTQWLPAARAFKYMDRLCPNVGGEAPAPDLNHMQSASFAWIAAQSGDPLDRMRAQEVFSAGVAGAYNIGSKQFNEAYGTSYLALGFLPN